MNKKTLGQFFTTNYEYILQNLHIPAKTTHITEPFCGNGDLLKFVKDKSIVIDAYDIEPKHPYIKQQDTLLHPPDYSNTFVLTNPPYLARNKSADKTAFDKYGVNDLYKCFLSELINNPCNGGIIIIPLNFWCSIRQMDIEIRKEFLDVYSVVHLNIFENQVFSDTTYAVCSFQFQRCSVPNYYINTTLYPCQKTIQLDFTNGYIGSEIYTLPTHPNYTISRLIAGQIPSTHILIKCIDDIHAEVAEPIYDNTPNQSCRTFLTLQIEPAVNENEQKTIVAEFNNLITFYREKYHSLFLCNYREGNRKRISFSLVYRLIGHSLTKNENR